MTGNRRSYPLSLSDDTTTIASSPVFLDGLRVQVEEKVVLSPLEAEAVPPPPSPARPVRRAKPASRRSRAPGWRA